MSTDKTPAHLEVRLGSQDSGDTGQGKGGTQMFLQLRFTHYMETGQSKLDVPGSNPGAPAILIFKFSSSYHQWGPVE
jgi:hypothetical protein